MCHQCDYRQLLEVSGLDATVKRLKIMEIIGNNNSPLSAQEIFETLNRSYNINRVTVYRTLEILVDKKLIERISGGNRSFHYGLAPNENHKPHPHFFCRLCGNMECLNPKCLNLDSGMLQQIFPGLIEKVEVRIDGLCKNCLRYKKEKDM